MKINLVSLSGGKDSTALLLLAIERQVENLQAVFADTGHEHSATYEYVRYLEKATGVTIRWVKADFSADIERKREVVQTKWAAEGVPQENRERALAALVPTGNPFLDLCIWKGRFPSTKVRFCSQFLKHEPIFYQVIDPLLEAGHEVISWQGVRADESLGRAKLPEFEELGGGLSNYRPLLKWSAQDVFAMHHKHGIEPNPLYRQGMGRVGCMPCIHARKDELAEIAKRFPDEIDRIERWEQIVGQASKRGETSLFPDPHRQAHKQMRGIRNMVEWTKCGRGGVQYDFVRMEPAAMCSSIYGLCE